MPTASEPADLPAGPLYCDASALAKLYLPEAGSDELNRMLAGRTDALVSDWAVTEVASALGRHARRGTLPPSVARRVHRRMLADVADGYFRRVELLSATHREAERILLASSAPLRAGDALHIALALGAGAGCVVAFDRQLARAALEVGLAAWPEPDEMLR